MPCKNAMINFFNQTIESLKIMDFLKKTVIITGANRGTGRCIAENFIANGAEVFIHSLKEGDSLSTVKEIGFGEPLWGDISCDSGSDRVLSQFKKKSQRLSILVNNLGSGSPGKWTDTSTDDWIESYQKNTLSTVRMVNRFLPILSSGGRIINIGTVGSTRPGKVMPHYYASKAALANLTSSLAKEIGERGITVNLVSPSLIRTEEVEKYYLKIAIENGWGSAFEDAERTIVSNFSPNPTGRMATKLEVANVVLFLASSLASFINGQNIKVDGGALDLI